MADKGVMTVPEFSAHIGCKRSYGYELKKAGRLVMAGDGKHVLVAESIERIAQTRDPSKVAVAARHAQHRGAPALTGHAAEPPPDIDSSGADSGPIGDYHFQNAKAKREHWAAEREHALFRKEAGELMERGAVVAAFAEAGAVLRGGLESWQSTLPPTLVGLDEAAIRATIADQVERLLSDLVGKFNQLAQEKHEREEASGSHD